MRILTALFFLFSVSLFGQNNSEKLGNLKNLIETLHPTIDFKDKLVIVSVWSVEDIESRELNKEAYRVYKIYERAKLKNGEKGTVFISVLLNSDEQIRNLAINKDRIDPAVVFSETGLKNLLSSQWNITNAQSNIVFDKSGEIKFQNVPKDQLFPSLRSLITR
jgi:hypothetical protein